MYLAASPYVRDGNLIKVAHDEFRVKRLQGHIPPEGEEEDEKQETQEDEEQETQEDVREGKLEGKLSKG